MAVSDVCPIHRPHDGCPTCPEVPDGRVMALERLTADARRTAREVLGLHAVRDLCDCGSTECGVCHALAGLRELAGDLTAGERQTILDPEAVT